MATLNQIRDAMHTQPFVPFAIRMADGRSYVVKHPDFMAIPPSPRSREAVLYTEGQTAEEPVMHRIDVGLVLEVITPAPAAQVPGPT
jgi:hypothetical protein